MAPFPDLPPSEVPLLYKSLIYFGILYVLSTAITTWYITRRRSFPKQSKSSQQETTEEPSTSSPQAIGINKAVSFDDTMDNLSSLKVEVEGAKAALEKLQELQTNDQLSQSAYDQLSEQYNQRVTKLTNEMNDMLKTDITSDTGEVDEGITDDEIDDLEADLERQLMDLDKDDSFLKPRAKRDMDEIFEDSTSSQQPSTPSESQPSPTTEPTSAPKSPTPPSTKPGQSSSSPTPPEPAQPASQPSAGQANPQAEKKKVPMPPPPNKPGSQPSDTDEKDSVTMPPPPKKAKAPPPPKKQQASSDQATQASQPKASEPLSAAQPMKVQADEDEEGMFAKSTSIAALRMDMLRELARLKKLIPEDQENDQ